MTLTTHAVVGAAAMTASVAALGPTPAGFALGCAAGFASHFAIDAIPHWDEAAALMRSFEKDPNDAITTRVHLGKDFIRDLAILAVDAGLGLMLSLLIFCAWLFHAPPPAVLAGAAAGIVPDPLQFVYFQMRWGFMRPLQTFHHSLQTEFKNLSAIGIEVILIVIVVAVLKFFI